MKNETIETVADQLYTAYCAAVDGKAFNGDPLPTWAEFRGDPDKQKQSDAWMAVAQKWVVIGMTAGSELICLERTRQIEEEGWTPEHDDKHKDFEMGKAADSYLNAVINPDEEGDENGKVRPAWDWPWDKDWWKPSPDPIRNLVKSGALIAAEIDRLQRQKVKS